MGYIYKITNKATRKEYIGQTIDLDERWYQHKYKKRSNCRYLKNAINKYGIEQFSFKLMCVCFDEDMDVYEQQYMEVYNTLVPDGYNLRKGGNGGKHHEETKQKISLALKGRCTYDVHPFTGKHHTDKTKDLISKKLKERFATDEGRKAKLETVKKRAVVQFDTDGNIIQKFSSLREAGSYLNVNHSQVSMVCSGKRKTVKGFVMKYADDAESVFHKMTHNTKDPKQNVSNTVSMQTTKNPKLRVTRPVIQFDMNGVIVTRFASCKEAAMKLEVSHAAVTMACRGKRKTLKGYMFKYENVPK